MGWRYLIFTIGGLTILLWIIRFFAFPMLESPRFLLGRGRDSEAVASIKAVAEYNKKEVAIDEEMLNAAARSVGGETEGGKVEGRYSAKHVRALFGTKKMAFSTVLLIAIWGWFTSFFSYGVGKHEADKVDRHHRAREHPLQLVLALSPREPWGTLRRRRVLYHVS
jgi:MFS family permease